MKYFLVIPVLVVLAACSRHAQQVTTNLSAEAWRQDLQYLARELPARHENAFHTIGREAFTNQVARLHETIPALNENERLVGLMRLAALVGDGHTHLDLPPSWPRYPFELAWFGSELRVVAATGAYVDAVGAKVISVGSTPVDAAMRTLSMLVPRGENEGRTRLTATMLFMAPAVVQGAGLSPSADEASFLLETADGKPITRTLRRVAPAEMRDMRLAGAQAPLWLQRLGEPWWTEVLPDGTVYFSFRGYPSQAEFRERTEALGRLLDASGSRRMVIDMRLNGGGDFDLGRQFLLPALQKRPAINRRGSLYVITGPGTFSAAMVNALDLRNGANAVLVGEPTGARPNSYSEHGEMRLPNSGLRVSFSTRHYRFAFDADTAVVPDILMEPTWPQFRAGKDPVLDLILAQPLPTAPGARLS